MTQEIDIKDIIIKIKKSRYILPIILILIAILFSTYFRMFSSSLPATDSWAGNVLKNNFYQEMGKEVRKEYPNLPQEKINDILDDDWIEYKKTEEYKQTIDYISYQMKAQMKDENGYTYLLAIDPYLWYAQAKHIMGIGDYTVAELREGRIDKPYSLNLHPYFTVALYKFLHIFNRNITLMRALFLMPVILIALSLVPAFFITKRVAGNFGGFFAAMLLAINQSLLTRTPAGFADNDAYNILMPLCAIWFLIIAWHSKDLKKTILFSILTGLMVGMYSALWGGWTYLLLLITVVLILYIPLRFIQKKKFKRTIYILIPFLVSSAFFISLTKGFSRFLSAFIAPLKFPFIKQVGVKTIWPNVMTTVAEFNEVAFTKVFEQFGGYWFFILMIAGLGLLLLKRKFKYSLLLTLWFIGTVYSFTQGVRFGMLAVPAFVVLTGIGVGIIYRYLSEAGKKFLHLPLYIAKPLVIILSLLLLIAPITDAKKIAVDEIPSFNDAWYNTLRAIHDDCEDGIITSWWDFGHWFTAVAERRVTFDGGAQKKYIYWVGKTLLTSNETEAVNILRMLNCGQNNYYEELVEQGMSEKEAIDTIHQRLSEGYDFCGQSNTEPLPQYLITSEDMINKGGVWAHFGSWDFDRAQLWNNVRAKKPVNISEEIRYQIMNTKADKWIADWPSYSAIQRCSKVNETLNCNDFFIDINTMEPYFIDGSKPRSFVYFDNETFVKKDYANNSQEMIGIALLPNNQDIVVMDYRLTGSMFTRMFFYEGIGLEYFKPFMHYADFTGSDIYTYKVNLTVDFYEDN